MTVSYRLRAYSRGDRRAVYALLSILPRLYPGGGEWLESRLVDVEERRARATVAEIDGRLLGITIETPKEARRLKLSTIWVAPHARGMGIGTGLLSAAVERWLDTDVERVHVTSAVDRAAGVHQVISKVGFNLIDVQCDRYGPGRDEAIFGWVRP